MTSMIKKSAVFVTLLSAGLTGCQPSKKVTVDRFKSTVPIVVQEGKSTDIKAWDFEANKSLDLQNSINTTGSSAVRTEVTSRCSRDGIFVTETFNLPGQADLKIFQMVPVQFLSNELATTVLQCSFEVSLFNEAGSNNVFSTASVPVVDLLPSSVRFQRGADELISSSTNSLLAFAENASDILLRFDRAQPSQATLACQDMEFSPVYFHQFIELSKFDLLAPKMYASRPVGTLISRPVQSCRVLFRQDGLVIAVSPSFKFRVKQTPLISETTAQLDPSHLNLETAELGNLPKLYRGERLEFSTVKVTNPTDGTRRIRFLKTAALGEIWYYIGSQTGIREVFTGHYFTKTFESLGRSLLTQDDKYWYLAVPAGDSFQIKVSVQKPGTFSCNAVGSIDLNGPIYMGFGLNAHDVEFDELLENNEVSRTWSLSLGKPVHFGMGQPYENVLNGYETHNPSLCIW